jgi:predicted MFS family arabinose efflux permease
MLGFSKGIIPIAMGLFLPGFMSGITNYSSNLMSLSEEAESKKRIGIHEALIGLAGCISGFWGGGVSKILGLKGLYYSCGLLIAVAILFQLIFILRCNKLS